MNRSVLYFHFVLIIMINMLHIFSYDCLVPFQQHTDAQMTRMGSNLAIQQNIYPSLLVQPSAANSGDHFSIDRHLREGNFYLLQQKDRQTTVRTAKLEDRILVDVWCVFHEKLLYPYHLQGVQGLCPQDYPGRTGFYYWLLQQCASNCSLLLFADKAGFTHDGIINFHNHHSWADVNPHGIIPL